MGFVDDSVIVRVDVQDVYSLWLDYEGYPRFMKGMDEVAVVGYGRLRWKGHVCGAVLDWEAEVVAHVQDTRVQWRASDGRETGEVSFAKLDAGETRVHYQLEYDPALWGVDEAGLRRCLHARVRDDLRAFKALAEAPAAS
jgi:uncharacterized membrane protein